MDAIDRFSCAAARRSRSLISLEVRMDTVSVFACGIALFATSVYCDCTAFRPLQMGYRQLFENGRIHREWDGQP